VLPGTDATQHLDGKLLTRSLAKCMARFQKAGISAFTLHDLRRTCRTGLARLKVESHIAERVLGHAQERIRATYDTHAYLDEKRAALERWSVHLAALTTRRRLAHSWRSKTRGAWEETNSGSPGS
jgi:integrase